MRQKIIDCINSSEFQNLLQSPTTHLQIDYGMLQVKKTSSIKHKGGLYFLYDDNSHNAYTKPVLWYLGINGNTKTETMRDRIIKHRRHALNLKSKSGNNINWSQFNAWLVEKGHAGENGVYDNYCKVLWLDLTNKNLSNQELSLLEHYCITTLSPIVNDSFDLNQAKQL
jgi:hypothetical protein